MTDLRISSTMTKKEKRKAYDRARYLKNIEVMRKNARDYYSKNRELCLKSTKAWNSKNREHIKKRDKLKYHSDPLFRARKEKKRKERALSKNKLGNNSERYDWNDTFEV